MLKSMMNLKGAQSLGKKEQLTISGGGPPCQITGCPAGLCCHTRGHCCDPNQTADC